MSQATKIAELKESFESLATECARATEKLRGMVESLKARPFDVEEYMAGDPPFIVAAAKLEGALRAYADAVHAHRQALTQARYIPGCWEANQE